MPPTRDADGNLITYVPRRTPLHPEAPLVPETPAVVRQPALTPSGCLVLPEAATDLESALALLNGIRACLLEAGLAVEATC